MRYIKALFNIERVHVEGSSLHYQLFYKHDNTYQRVNDKEYATRAEAMADVNELLEE